MQRSRGSQQRKPDQHAVECEGRDNLSEIDCE